MSCTYRVTVTRPDGRREDIELDDLMQESLLIQDLDSKIEAIDTKIKNSGLDLLDLDEFEGIVTADLDPDGEPGFNVTTKNGNGVGTPSDLFVPKEQEYTEIAREVETVEIGSSPNVVTIERMTSVTFENFSGKTLKLIFNNDGQP